MSVTQSILAQATGLQAYLFGPHYVLPHDYEKQSAAAKQDLLWQTTQASRYEALPPQKMPAPKTLFQSLVTGLAKTFDHASDILPPNRKKAFHPFGVVATADFVPEKNSGYSGIFLGAKTLLRLSHGFPGAIVPGIGVKYFIDGRESVNTVSNHNLDGENNTDFFTRTHLTNILPMPKNPLLLPAMLHFAFLAKKGPLHIPIENLAAHDQFGNATDESMRPYQIFYVPHAAVKGRIPTDSKNDFRKDLIDNIPQGTPLYDVYVTDTPDGDRTKVGTLVTTSDFVASQFGDEQLFFRHQRGKDLSLVDLAIAALKNLFS